MQKITGYISVIVSGKLRLVLRFDNQNAIDVN